MTWQKGQSGNPDGARVKARRFGRILDRALLQEDAKAEEDHRIRQAIERQMDKAADGDLAAVQFIADRTDGKPEQAVTLGGDPENPLIARIETLIVDPKGE